VTEALDNDGNEFGVQRMTESIRESAPHGAQAVVKRLIDDVRSFAASNPQHDDITLIAIRKT
jgi:sigma-B regulation protein RsbU (phosphoserine phosphatase)